MDQLRASDPLSPDWLVGVLVLAVGVLAWVNMVSPRQWAVLARSAGAFRLGRQRLRDELDMRDRTLTVLAVMSTLVIALFIHQVLLYHGLVAPGPLTYLWTLLAVAGVLLAQAALLRAVRWLPEHDGGLRELLYTTIVLHVVLGLLLMPVAAVMAFPGQAAWRQPVWITGAALLVAMVLFRWVRAVAVGIGNGAPLRYILLYLCALEILPAALVLEQLQGFVPPVHHP